MIPTSTLTWRICRISCFLAFTGFVTVFLESAALAEWRADRLCTGDDQVRLQITVAGVRNARGTITINLYGDRDADFLKKGKRLSRIRVPAQMGEVVACMSVPTPGSYAISLYHDEDGSKKLSKNFLGLPKEGYGFSRDAPVSYRLPDLDEAVFTALPGDTRIRVTMRY